VRAQRAPDARRGQTGGVTRRVAVMGAAGRMGRTVCAAVVGDPDCELVAAVDPHHAGLDLSSVAGVDTDVVITADVGSLDGAGVDVAVDFTEAAAARENLRWCAAAGVHAVVGTTGLGDDDLEELRSLFTTSNCVVAPNFAIGAVLMMRLAELAAQWFETVEIIELHHDAKVDAPSGTAVLTAQRIAAASSDWAPDPTVDTVLEGARGGRGPAGIPIHAVRLRGLVAHQEVLFGTTGQTLSIRHDSTDRSSFMPGVLLAVKAVADRPGLTVGLDALLGV
jgi:4-hydroxy-tetrahydrodipicolinate reductase